MMESYELARTKAYKSGDTPEDLPRDGSPDLDANYVKKGSGIVSEQLKKGGIRLATILNSALAPDSQ